MDLWKDQRLRLSITTLGLEYLAALLIVGAFAVHTGNNLLYLIFSMMLGLFLTSGWVSRRALQGLAPERVEDGKLFARMQGGVELRFRDRAPGRTRCLEVRLEVERVRVEPGFYPGGAAGANRELRLRVFPERRGWCAVRWLELATAYPFGFLEKAWRFPQEGAWLVLPHPRSVAKGRDGEGAESRLRSQTGGSPDGARPYREGDPLSRVHWKRTAQRGAPWVRTFEDGQPAGVQLRLDLRAWAPGPGFEKQLEYLSGAVLRARLQRRGISLRVTGTGGSRDYEGCFTCWKALAVAAPEAGGAFHAPGSTLPS
jgi:uncharacterized protein (DUF58 family)